MQLDQINVGSKIEVIDNMGFGPVRQGTVTDFEHDYRGHSTIIYQDDDGKERWAFLGQILDIIDD